MYLGLSQFLGDTYVLSFVNSDNITSSSIEVIESATPDVASITHASVVPFGIYKQVAIDSKSGLFVMVTQDYSSKEAVAQVVAGRLLTDHSLSFGDHSIYSYANYSVTPDIDRMDNLTFAIVYYDGLQVSSRIGNYLLTLIMMLICI
jgi:hypothetical protein